MANDKYINETGLSALKTWLVGKFATITNFNALSEKVDDIVTQGGEPNTIESITLNGTTVTPDANKNVALTSPTKTSDLTNDGDGTSNFATESYVTANGGKIDTISVNGTAQSITNKNVNITVPVNTDDLVNNGDGTSPFATEQYVNTNGGKIDEIKVNNATQTITDKTVNITVPTNVSDLNNDSGFLTEEEVQEKIDASNAAVYRFKGSVATVDDLPTTGNKTGDVYDVQSTGVNYAWDGEQFDPLGHYVDTEELWAKDELTAMTVTEINEILNA